VALTATLSSQEFARISALAYEGLACRVSLHVNSGSLTAESAITEWDAVKLPAANGYEDFTVASLPAGGLDLGSDDRWEIGGSAGANTYIEAAFTAEGSGFSFDTVVIQVGTGTYPHSILVEAPSVTVAAGQTQTYRIQLLIDNI
jgi:hypothetical protein